MISERGEEGESKRLAIAGDDRLWVGENNR
jgi:hypothetical protein